jgi:hypothetical protein
VNALQWDIDPREVAPQIVDAILLDAEDRRIFISYARSDGGGTAEEIFDALSAARFDVFLDRFKLPPGEDFVERIEDEILDKSMVVVVETEVAARSEWVRHEVAVAVKRGLGLAAVNLGAAPPTPGIGEGVTVPRRDRFRPRRLPDPSTSRTAGHAPGVAVGIRMAVARRRRSAAGGHHIDSVGLQRSAGRPTQHDRRLDPTGRSPPLPGAGGDC